MMEERVDIQEPPGSDVSPSWRCAVHVQAGLVAGQGGSRPSAVHTCIHCSSIPLSVLAEAFVLA